MPQKRILVVDDDCMILALVEDLLLDLDHVPLLASNGVEVRALIAEHGPPDAMIVDYDIGGVAGTDLYVTITETLGFRVPAVLFTGHGHVVRPLADAAGMGFLAKPASNDAIRAVIAEMLAQTVAA